MPSHLLSYRHTCLATYVASSLKVLALIAVVSSLSSCNSSDDDSSSGSWWAPLVQNCQINSDQKGSFMAPVKDPRITLTVDTLISTDPDHGDSWMKSVRSAADKWNDLGQTLRNNDFFTVKTGAVPGDVRTNLFSNCQIADAGDENHFYLMLEKDPVHWEQAGFSSSIPGATVRCYQGGVLTSQIIMVRTDLIKDTQFTSVVLHEMGHSLGLEHSCTYQGSSDQFANCADFASDEEHPYNLAVMFPSLREDRTEWNTVAIKEDLQANDIDRAKCFY